MTTANDILKKPEKENTQPAPEIQRSKNEEETGEKYRYDNNNQNDEYNSEEDDRDLDEGIAREDEEEEPASPDNPSTHDKIKGVTASS
jgi:hypothetical protein